MSSKKDNFNLIEESFMKIAINLANLNDGFTGPNPSVGCVVVKDKKIVSYGTTKINGRPHAESIALDYNRKNLKKSDMYITLEPCSHYGKTPPCTDKIIKSKIKKVVYSINDYDLRSSKKSKVKLNSKGINVKTGLLENKVKKIYKKYIYSKKKNLPYTVGKLACSVDYFILNNKNYITNKFSRNVTHLLRSKNQAILTSYKTINNDNPKMNCRISGLENLSPIRIVLDRNLNIKLDTFLVKTSNNIKTYIYHNSPNKSKINKLKSKGVILIKSKVINNCFLNIKELLKDIYKKGIHSVLVECGKTLTLQMLREDLINEFYLFIGDKKITNKKKINVLSIKNILNAKYKNKNLINRYLENDKLTHYS